MNNSYQHWQLKKDDQDIVWALLNRQGTSVNSLNNDVLQELSLLLDQVAEENARGLIITSSKTSGFIAGADVEQFTQMKEYDEGLNFLRRGQEVFSKLEKSPAVTVALINGFCLGGGFELALACDYRVALDDLKTRIGLPEVMLGIHPGWGGTVRLPRLVGAISAMNIILTGRSVDARRAKNLGLVHAVAPLRQLNHAAEYFVLNKPETKVAWLKAQSNHRFVRPVLAKFMQRQVAKKANKDHYPAPFAAIEHWLKYGVSSSAYEHEARSVADLFMTDTSRNLLRVFFLQTRMKSLPGDKSFKAKHVHVIGAGVMGGDIAAWCALKGIQVTLQDTEASRIAPAIKRAYQLFKKKLKRQHLVEAAMDRLQPDIEGRGVPKADVIIEAIFENLEVKQALFKRLEEDAKPDALLATNTSSIPLDDISEVMHNPSRLLGIHFFNPVAMMQLIEIVKSNSSNAESIAKAIQFVKQLGKLPLPVKSSPGFLINRILMPYLMESVVLLDKGHAKEEIDLSAKAFGMPMGPIELADTVGLDVCLSVAQNLSETLGSDIPECLVNRVKLKQLGKKTGEGFYQYKKGKIQRLRNKVSVNTEVQERLIAKITQESHACLSERVVEDADLLDAGMIFGTGFAPFRGGPIHYSAEDE